MEVPRGHFLQPAGNSVLLDVDGEATHLSTSCSHRWLQLLILELMSVTSEHQEVLSLTELTLGLNTEQSSSHDVSVV